ncbi:glycosyl transferase family 1, partial [Tamlana crocina]|nr:glycosyl transferase family 1 [Tamlana crocina]
ISMFSNHFFNWTEQLRDSGHEIYWIDVFDSNTYVEKIDFVHQIIGWRNRVDYPGRYWVKNNLPEINHFLNYFNQRELSDFVDQKIQEFKPDVVQSFVLYSAAYPILSIMKNYPQIKWIYSAWGNDLFFRQQQEDEL